MRPNITNDHINFIEKELFPDFDFSQGKVVFDCERRKVIKCMETKDIVACAGSGKTTTLIAKLMILDRFFMDFPKNRGICVLTHTNVAIDEIKEKLGSSSRFLKYPNFFGTIQSFVNQFLTKPAFISEYGKQPKGIDTDTFINQMGVEFRKAFTDEEQKYFQEFFEENLKGKNLFKKMNLTVNQFRNYYLKKSSISQEQRNSFEEKFKEICNTVIENGYFDFDDAYFFANKYKDEYQEELKKMFSQRFQFVFIDEMQDTETYQKEILDTIFDKKQTIIQQIGDNNQAIYSGAQTLAWKPEEPYLSITGSKRYHNQIAKLADKIAVDIQNMEGNGQEEFKPIIILFEDAKVEEVIPKFGELVLEKKLYQKKYPIKAVGGLTYLPHIQDKHFIRNYFRNFEKPVKDKEPYYETLRGFFKHNPENKSANYYRKTIIGAILKIFSLVGKSGYDEKTFIKEFKEKAEYNTFLIKMTDWCRKMHLNQDTHLEVKNYLEIDLALAFRYSVDKQEITDFLTKDGTNFQANPKYHSHKIFYKDSEDKDLFEIEIGTVHSVKGETHTATLYLETPNYNSEPKEYDIKQLLSFFKGNHDSNPSDNLKRALRIAHVAVTRPKHLLCVAIHKSSLSNLEQDKQELDKAGWKVEEL